MFLRMSIVLLAIWSTAVLAGQAEPGAVAQNKGNPALKPIEDTPGLPRVLLIGDSISIGYTLNVRELMAGVANVHRIPENGGPTSYAVERIDEWLGKGDAAKWDVIHFNWGLHDIKILDGKHQVSIEQYEKNLRALVAKMKATGAELIWCTTTPVPPGKLSPLRKPGDEIAFNAVAKKVMDESGVTRINDLYGFASQRLEQIQQKENVHFFAKGSAALAVLVRDAIEAALPKKAGAPKVAPQSAPAAKSADAPDSPVFYLQAATEAKILERPSSNEKQRFPFGWKGIELAPDGALNLTFNSAVPTGAKQFRLRLTVAVDVREEKMVWASVTGSGEKLGDFDIRYASMIEPFEIALTAEQAALALKSGVTLKMVKGGEPLAILWNTPEPALNPHLLAARDTDPRAEFFKRMNSLASIQQFGWMEGCVLDGLLDLEAVDPAFAATHQARRHLDLFTNAAGELRYEDHVSQPRVNGFATIEATLPMAAMSRVFPDHPSLAVAEKFWRQRAGTEGLIVDGKTITSEGAYTLGYPLAALSVLKKDDSLRALALSQLKQRQKFLAVDGGVHQRANIESAKAGYKNWARGIAWYMLGFARTLSVLKEHNAETTELRAEFQRCAEWVVTLQQPDGLWLCFAHDSKTTDDTSGSAGIAAALAIGVNEGLLPAKFLESARKTDAGLQKYLTPDGFLTGVAQSNKGGEGLQRGNYRVIFQMGMGLYAQLAAALQAKNK